MTREQRLELLKQIEKDIYVCSLESTLLDDAKSCAIHSVIRELEQQVSILDKIRAEIMQLDYDTESVDYDYNDMPQTEIIHTICREEVLRIIDKYKAESEDKE